MIKPTSVSFEEGDKLLLTRLHQRTGLSRTVLLRRLLRAYATGIELQGLPKIDPPLLTEH